VCVLESGHHFGSSLNHSNTRVIFAPAHPRPQQLILAGVGGVRGGPSFPGCAPRSIGVPASSAGSHLRDFCRMIPWELLDLRGKLWGNRPPCNRPCQAVCTRLDGRVSRSTQKIAAKQLLSSRGPVASDMDNDSSLVLRGRSPKRCGCGEDAGAPLCGELGFQEPLHIIYYCRPKATPVRGA
jgi:hypothetical protein